jgi:hypothetical protein
VLGALAAACALSIVLPVGAPAADDMIDVPVDAPTVATSPSGAAVIAWVAAGDRLCTVVQLAGTERPARIDGGESTPAAGMPSGNCVEMPVDAQFDAQQLGTTIVTRDRHLTWGSTGTGSATVELRRRGALFGAGPSTPSPLPGAGADLRFFAIEHAAGPVVDDSAPIAATVAQADQLVLRDASGTVRRADDLFDPRPIAGPVLQRGRKGTVRWVLTQRVTRELAPTPLDAERRETRRCLEFRTVDGSTRGFGDSDICDGDPDGGRPYLLQVATDCLLGGRVEVLVREPARRIVAILGDGRRRAVPLVALSPGTRVGTLVLGRGIAVRRTLALSATGRVLATQPMGIPPQPRQGCLPSYSDLFGSDLQPPTPPLGAGPHALHVTDHAERICVAFGRAARVPQECALPPVDPDVTRLTLRRTPAGRVIYGVVPTEITTVRVRHADGSTQTFTAAPIEGYAGRYAAALRQVVVDLPDGTPVAEVAVLDERGRVLFRLADAADAEDVLPQRPRTVLRVPGVPPLRVLGDASRDPDRVTCLWVGSPPSCMVFVNTNARGAEVGWAYVGVRCAPRQILVLAVLPRRADRLVVRTASGREVVAHRARIPAGFGPGSGLYAQLAVVGPHEGIAALVQRGPSREATVPSPLPPAARQCGYTVLPGLS